MSNIENVLELCLEHLESGEMTIAECLSTYPQYAEELHDLLTLAQAFQMLPPVSIAPEQIQRMEAKLLPRKTPSFTWLAGGFATLIFMFFAGWVILNSTESAAVIDPTETATITLTYTATPTSAATATHTATGTPTNTPTITPSPTRTVTPAFTITPSPTDSPATQQAEIIATLEGTIEMIDGNTITVDGVEIEIPQEMVEGCDDCHPVLLILSQHYGVPYEELESLHNNGYGIGEISKLLSDNADAPGNAVQQANQNNGRGNGNGNGNQGQGNGGRPENRPTPNRGGNGNGRP